MAFIAIAGCSAPSPTKTPNDQDIAKGISFIQDAFSTNYAPAAYKKELFGWDLNQKIPKKTESGLTTMPQK